MSVLIVVINIKKYTVISTFCGTGGSSLGYKWAGFKELLAIDNNKHAAKCFKLNFDKVPVWEKDIKEVFGKEILNFCNIKKGELDVLDGSPPCQGFSMSGKRNIKDTRNDLFKEYVRLIQELEPKVFVMENVPGMAQGKMKGRFIEIIKKLKTLNYNVKCKKMNSKHYNVPQSRERLIFIGVRKDLKIMYCYPVPNNKIITVSKILKDMEKQIVPELSKCLREIVPKMKAGQNANDVTGKGHFQTQRIFMNKPCPTITKIIGGIGFGSLIHPYEDRVLSINEIKRICSFPDSWKLTGDYKLQKAVMGNAVMPKFMQAIAENIKENILDKYYGV